MPFPVGAAISAGGSILSGIIGNAGRRREAQRQRDFQIEFWNRQNEYNSPLNQRRRFEEAGYNPNLFYGQGTNGNAEKIGQYQQPEIQNIPFGESIGQYFNVQLQQKQLDNVDAQTQNLRQEKINKILDGQLRLAQGDKTRSEAVTAKAQAQYSRDAFRLQNDQMAQDIKKKASEINLNSKQAQKIISDTKLNKADLDWMKKTGLHRHDPVLAKNAKYLSEITGISPVVLIGAIGGLIGLKSIISALPINKVGKLIPKNKR